MKDKSDAEWEIVKHLELAKTRHEVATARVLIEGGNVPTVAIDRWESAKLAEVDISI